jgi:hypothetical protein
MRNRLDTISRAASDNQKDFINEVFRILIGTSLPDLLLWIEPLDYEDKKITLEFPVRDENGKFFVQYREGDMKTGAITFKEFPSHKMAVERIKEQYGHAN